MRLFYSPASPFVRKVMVVLVETGQINDVTLVPASGTALDPGTMPVAQNPLGKIPALERDEGGTLYDSRVICRYLDHRGKAGLYPSEPELWDVLTLEATADGLMDAAVLIVYEARIRPEEIRMPDWVEGQWSKVARALDALNDRWLGHLNGPLNIGQVATGCALGYLDLRHDARNWRQGRDGLATWYERFAQRPSMAQTAPKA